MRREIAALALIILCLLMPSSASAADSNTYRPEDLDISVSLPSDYVVFTRDLKADDPNLAVSGFTKEEMASWMTSNDVYLDAWGKDINPEILIKMGSVTGDD